MEQRQRAHQHVGLGEHVELAAPAVVEDAARPVLGDLRQAGGAAGVEGGADPVVERSRRSRARRRSPSPSRARGRGRAPGASAASFGRISGTIQASGGARQRARSTSSTVSTAGRRAPPPRRPSGRGRSSGRARASPPTLAPHSRRISAMCSTESSGLTGATIAGGRAGEQHHRGLDRRSAAGRRRCRPGRCRGGGTGSPPASPRARSLRPGQGDGLVARPGAELEADRRPVGEPARRSSASCS